MILWCGTNYKLIPGTYNGTIYGYLVDGKLRDTQPRWTFVKGHILTPQGVIIVLARKCKLAFITLGVSLAVFLLALIPYPVDVYYQVTFEPQPLLRNETLYCNVVNEDIFQVTVQFSDGTNNTMTYELEPGDTLPYVLVEFVPTVIRYNNQHEFPLEVRLD